MDDTPMPIGSPFHGRHREARVQRFQAKVTSPRAQRRRKAKRKAARRGRRAAR